MMDEKILKWSARGMAILAILVSAALFHFPQMESYLAAQRQRKQQEAEERARKEAEKEAIMTAQIEALMEQKVRAADTEQQEPSEEPEKHTVLINSGEEKKRGTYDVWMELPSGVETSKIKIVNDCIKKAVRISFPGSIKEYLEEGHVWGSDKRVFSTSYYTKSGNGVLELALDKIYEVTWTFEQGILGMKLEDPHKKYRKIVVVDAGHGGIKTGAEREGVEEKRINLEIVKALREYWKEQKDPSIGIFFTRLTDTDVSLEERVGLANELKADLFISIHNNSTASLSAAQMLSGTQILYSESDRGTHSSRAFAQICLDSLTSELGSRNLGLLKGDDIYIIRNSKMPAALAEIGFLTNQKERARLQTEDYQKKTAKALYQAMQRAFQEGF